MSSVYSRLKAIKSLKSTGVKLPELNPSNKKEFHKTTTSNQDLVSSLPVGNQHQPLVVPNSIEDWDQSWNEPLEGIWYRRRSIPLEVSSNFITTFLVSGGIDAPLESVYWFDTETTGLNGGAGTVIFLFGWARWHQNQWELHQVILQDYGFESIFWEFIVDKIQEARVLVSYNGLSYDQPLVLSRCIMNGIGFNPPDHVDLLHSVRRIWKTEVSSCSLNSIEQQVLRIHRIKDISGSLIPLGYFDYLRKGGPIPTSCQTMDLIVSHHEMDHWSMILLSEILGKIYSFLNPNQLSHSLSDGSASSPGIFAHSIPYLSLAGLLKTARSKHWLSFDLIGWLLSQLGVSIHSMSSQDLLELARSYYSLQAMEQGLPYFDCLLEKHSNLWALYRVVVWLEWGRGDSSLALKYLTDYKELWSQVADKPKKGWQKRYARLIQKVSRTQKGEIIPLA